MAVSFGPIALTAARISAVPVALGAIGGISAYYYEQFIQGKTWLYVLIGVLAGLGAGTFIVMA